MTDWVIVKPAQSNVGVDVADAFSAGAGAIAPLNVNVYGSHFIAGLENRSSTGGMSTQITGLGAGSGVGAGWGLPFVGAKGIGKLPEGVKRKAIEALGKSGQGEVAEYIRDAVWDGASAGTRVVAGPDSNGFLTASDFHDTIATIVSLGANFTVNGVSAGVLLISKSRAILSVSDLLYVRAIGLIAGVGLATSLDIEASGMVYKISFM